MRISHLYRNELRLVRGEYRNWIIIVGVLFSLVAAGSYLYLTASPADADRILGLAESKLPQINSGEGIIGILLRRNLLATALITFSGFFTFGLLPLANIAVNAFIIGTLLNILSIRMAVSPFRVIFFGILPHGLFEIPALVLAGALGIRLGAAVLRRLAGRSDKPLTAYLGESARTFGLVIVPLLLLAAIIEGTLTINLINFFLNP